ncbi:hypothetical protein [Paraburkholderia sp. BR14374]|uniref:hypothetical protein n=1 Tax=Paraburkholderia sp. BR14374 TaxID=3237007 RepID=UPI0034CDA178
MLSVQYDPATWQTRLNAARAARARDRAASALLGDAQPLHFQPHSAGGDKFEVAGIPNMTGNPNSWIESGPGMKKQWRKSSICSSSGNMHSGEEYAAPHKSAFLCPSLRPLLQSTRHAGDMRRPLFLHRAALFEQVSLVIGHINLVRNHMRGRALDKIPVKSSVPVITIK